MMHEDQYIEDFTFLTVDGDTVHIDCHDKHALHNDTGVVKADNIAVNAITEEKITDEAVTSYKLATNAVTKDKIVDGAITNEKIDTGAITRDKIDPELINSWDSISQIDGGVVNVATDNQGRILIPHGLGVTPKSACLMLGTGNTEAVATVAKPLVNSLDASYIRCNIFRTDHKSTDDKWLAKTPVQIYWIAVV